MDLGYLLGKINPNLILFNLKYKGTLHGEGEMYYLSTVKESYWRR